MDDKKASKLVESVIMGIPIPTVFLCEELNGAYSIIDGQQRMTSFTRYLENEFALSGLEEIPELNGKKFKDLGKPYQRTIKNSTLNSIILLKESQELKYEIFARLNQGSIKLRPQELRNCVYRGSFNNMIESVAKTNRLLPQLFLEENKRKNYQEYILRFFALRNYLEYSSSLTKTMNNYMLKHQNDSDYEIESAKKLFNKTMDIIKQVLGENAFCAFDRQNHQFLRKFGGSVFDSIAVACSFFDPHDLMSNADEIRKQINDLKMNSAEYQDYTYAATGSKSRVIGRITMIYGLISKIVGKVSNENTRRIFAPEVKDRLWHDGYICTWCGQTILTKEDAEIDHILAYSNGGETELSNAQLLHRHCNREKNASNVDFDERTDTDEVDAVEEYIEE